MRIPYIVQLYNGISLSEEAEDKIYNDGNPIESTQQVQQAW